MHSEKATKCCKISTLDLSYVKSTVEISQNFVAFSEYINFNEKCTVHSISAQTSQQGIKCTKSKD